MEIPSLGRADWIREHLEQLPDLILHIRDQRVPGLPAAGTQQHLGGSGDKAAPPLRLDPMDDADELWGMVCSLAGELSQRTRERLPIELAQQRTRLEGGAPAVCGFATSDPATIYRSSCLLTWWMVERAVALALGHHYIGSVDELVERVTSLRGRYANAPRPVRARLRCPVCGRFAVVAEWTPAGSPAALLCQHCGARKEIEEPTDG